jgi:hypothetical protein
MLSAALMRTSLLYVSLLSSGLSFLTKRRCQTASVSLSRNERLEEAASEAHLSVSAFVLQAASRAADNLLAERLATDTRVAGLGLGTQLVKHILATAAELNV